MQALLAFHRRLSLAEIGTPCQQRNDEGDYEQLSWSNQVLPEYAAFPLKAMLSCQAFLVLTAL